jgi:hypothetical protein
MRVRVNAVWISLGMLVGGQASAAESTNAAESGPDIELLEYLGGLVQEQGRWVGPDDMKGSPDERTAPAPIVSDDDVSEDDVSEDEE